jgi:hypothetical protein
MARKSISDAFGPKKPLYPEQMQQREVRLSDAMRESSDESLRPTNMTGPNPNPIPITDGPEPLVLQRNVGLDGRISYVSSNERLSQARALGVAGEEAVGVGEKTRIPSLTGTAEYRIPDQLTSTTLVEVKNVSHQTLTKQLMDFHLYSQQTGRQFILYTRPNTTFSGPLQNLINNGSILNMYIPIR